MKKIILILGLSLWGYIGIAQQQVINLGAAPNDGTGDPLRTAFTKTNANFTELYSNVVASANVSGTNTYTAAPDPPFSYTHNNKVICTFSNSASGVSTLNLNSGGAKNIYTNPSTQATTGDIIANTSYLLIYNSTLNSGSGGFILIGGGAGGGGPSDHAALSNLSWTTSAHTGTANRIAAFNGSGAASLLAVGTDVQAFDSDLSTIGGLSPSNDDFLQRKSGAWANRTIAQVKTDLSLTGTNSGDQTLNSLLPTQTGHSGEFLTTNGTNSSWAAGGGGGSLTVGTTAIASGTTTRVLFNNAGTLGEYSISGTGNVAMTTSPSFTTPNIGTATGSITGNAATVTTNANLTGHITSTGNAAVLGSFTSANLRGALSDELGTGASLFDGATPTSLVGTNISGTAAGLTAGTVTTNANLTGPVTSSGNATSIANGAISYTKLANGTDGELITWDASGVAATVPVGTSGHVLTSNGTGAAPTFQAAGGTFAAKYLTHNVQTGNYTLVLADADTKSIVMRSVSPQNLTVPTFASVAFPEGTTIIINPDSTGVTTIVAASGVNIESSSGLLTSNCKDCPMVLEKKNATNNWFLRNGSPPLGAALTKTDDVNLTLTLGGAPSTATLTAVSLTLGWSPGTFLAVNRGGTGADNTTTTYTPTLFNTANVASSTAILTAYYRIGSTATVFGQVTIDPDVTLTLTTLGMGLPIASNFTTANQAGGTVGCDVVGNTGRILSDATNDRVLLQFTATDVTSKTYGFQFSYQIL